MNPNEQEEWKNMKKNWQSASVAEFMMTQQLRWGLRMRMVGSWVWLGLEVVATLLISVLGILQMAMGQQAAGLLFIAIGLICAAASWWARRAPLRGASGSLVELVDLSLRRARRGVRMAWANYFMTAATAAWIFGMYSLPVGDPDAAYHRGANVGVAMVMLGIYAVGVGFYHAYARARVRRFTELRAQLNPQSEE